MPSLFVAALPASIQSRIPRIPRIPSLRRTMSVQGLFSRSDPARSMSISTPASMSTFATTESQSASPSLSTSPPSSSASDMSSPLPSLPSSRPSTAPGMQDWHERSRSNSSNVVVSTNECGLVLASSGQVAGPAGFAPSALSSPAQINWKYAQNGFRSLQNAAREAGDPDRLPALERQMYVESVVYLLRGLPSDLGDGELSQLRHAAPDKMVAAASSAPPPAPVHVQVYQSYPFAAASAAEQKQLQLQGRQDALPLQHLGVFAAVPPPPLPPRRSLPHRTTHWLITRIYALVLALLPVVVRLANWALEMQRKHHVPEAVLRWATALVVLVCRHAVELYVAVCAMGDGSVKRALDDGTMYLASGVVAGFREAVLDVARGEL